MLGLDVKESPLVVTDCLGVQTEFFLSATEKLFWSNTNVIKGMFAGFVNPDQHPIDATNTSLKVDTRFFLETCSNFHLLAVIARK